MNTLNYLKTKILQKKIKGQKYLKFYRALNFEKINFKF